MNIPGNPTYNLLEQAWIPVRDEDGMSWMIAPHDLVTCGPGGKLPVALHAERPDFNGALAQFLIGLVQTAFAPASDRDWRRYLKAPPDAEALRDAFACYRDAFHLDGDGPRFMQDYHFVTNDPTDRPKDEDMAIGKLLIDANAESNTYFNKERTEQVFSQREAATALFMLQISAPSSGRGHRTSLRGPSPLTTLVLGKTLWQTVWLNVLTRQYLNALGSTRSESPEDFFPWMKPTPTSETGVRVTRDDAHPLQMFWAMPKRIVLQQPVVSPSEDTQHSPPLVRYRYFRDKHAGINYTEPWSHPLSPYERLKDQTTRSIRAKLEFWSYRYWLGLAVPGNAHQIQPALVVTETYRRSSTQAVRELLPDRTQLWVFGYAMDNAKAEGWIECQSPLYLVASERREQLEDLAATMVKAADQLVEALKKALKKAFYGTCRFKNNKVQWDFAPQTDIGKSILVDTVTRFWRDTEPDFHNNLRQFAEASTTPSRNDWGEKIKEVALDLFEEVTQYGVFRGLDPKSVVKAREELKAAKPKL
jgi:CRISPR system Cascade subunit CasA